jgi:hypothetical protein
MLSKLLKHARLSGYINWNDVEDRIRAFHDLTGFTDEAEFIDQEKKKLLKGYGRNLLQSQKKYIEVWIEKDALSSIFTKVCSKYSVPVIVCRGFSSVSFLNDFRDRLRLKADKIPLMLYFGDFDPSGMEMLKAMKTTLRDEFNIDNMEFKRIALLEEDINIYELPHNPDAIKKKDTRSKKHVKAFGELAVELDALRPDILEEKIEGAILNEIEINLYHKELIKEQQELDKLNSLRENVIEFLDKEVSQ